MSTFRRITMIVALMVLTAVVVAESAQAVPAFARKYRFSCTTCHAPFPRLKEFGEEFAGRGFQLEEGQEPERAYRDTGDPLLTLQRELPLGVRFDAYGLYDSRNDGESDLQTPWGMKLLSGGKLANKVGYYFYFYVAERGEVAGIEDAYVHFDDVRGLPLDVMVGQFQISDPMMKRELRLSYEDYEAYRVRPGMSASNLTYDRGVMIVYDTPFGLGLVGEIVNGNGKPEAGEDRRFDNDRDKGYAIRANYGVGPLSVGGFYYATAEQLGNEDGSWTGSNEVEVLGPDLSLALGEKAQLTAQALFRKDSHPAQFMDEIETEAVVAELALLPQGADGRHAMVLLYNWVDSQDDAIDYHTGTVSASYLYARNLRFIAEFTRDFDLEESRVVIGIVSGY